MAVGVALNARAQSATISEFMAVNDSGLKDEDGEYSDWIEIFNRDAERVNLQGWYLTDDQADRTKWQFPIRNLGAGEYLIVFASGKDRKPPQGNLHTNFRLAGDGGYLALVRPDGTTIEKEFAPYPPQRPNFAFGARLVENRTTLVAAGAPAKILVPKNDNLGFNWTGGNEPFNDSAWQPGQNGVGYVVSTAGFMVQNFKSQALVEDLGAAEEVIQNPALQANVAEENTPMIDYLGTVDPGHYAVDRPFPGAPAGQDVDDFVVLATGKMEIPAAGDWTFGVMSDDGFGLVISRGAQTFEMSYPTPRGPSDTLQTFRFPEAGAYDIRLVYFERNGGSGLEFFAAQGVYSVWDADNFRLAGDVAAGGLAVQSSVVSGGGAGDFQDFIKTDLRLNMENLHSSAYLRIPWVSSSSPSISAMFLQMRYDDGFVAFLNGTEIARRNAPAVAQYNSTALTNRSPAQAVISERINVSQYAGLSHPGTNILAIHGLCNRPDSPDFLISGELDSLVVTVNTDGYFDVATPGAANSAVFAGFIEKPLFNMQRGFYEQPIDLTLLCNTDGAAIRYTTNGNPPTVTTGRLYTNPIHIASTTVIRAGAFKSGYRPSEIDTHSYVFLNEVIQQDSAKTLAAGFPNTWKVTAPDYGMDRRVIGQNGADNYGGKYARTIKDDLKSIPTLSLVMNLQDLFGTNGIYSNPLNRGTLWEKPVSAELIFPSGVAGFQANAGLSIQGGAFRDFGLTKKKSFRLLFKNQYGASKLRFPFFGSGAVDQFDSLTLRANNNDGYQWDSAGGKALYIRDAFAQALARDMGMVVPHSTFVHLYINGFYWGLYNPVERPDAAFSASYFGGQKEDWDAINYDSAPDGTYDAWNRMLAQANSGLANNVNYQKIQGNNPDGVRNPQYEDLLDVDNMIDYLILNFYGGNEDWPHRNWYAGRNRLNGGGFKFFPWDTEAAFNLWATLNSDRTGVNNAAAAPYGAAKANADFKMRFADHVYKHFYNGGVYYVDTNNPAWDPAHPERNRPAALFVALASQVERAMVGESARWGDQHAATPYTRDEHWSAEKTNMLKNYFPQRSGIVLEQFRRAGLYPRTEPPIFSPRGGRVPVGCQLIMTSTPGTIYYTTNGTDPRAPVITEEVFRATLAARTAAKKALVPSAANGGDKLGSLWRGGDEPFNDAAWKTGAGGVGYDRESTYLNFIQIDLKADMDNKNGSAFIRIPFIYDGTNRQRLNFMTLSMRYDDGFVAYLNGVKIASAHEPTTLAWNSTAAAQNSDTTAVAFEEFKADNYLSALKTGANILAIQGLNIGLSSTDFLIDTELAVGERKTTSATNTALRYTNAVALRDLTTVKARVWSGSEWSALEEAKFVVGDPALVLSELNYHPADPTSAEVVAGFENSDDFEFIELMNPGTETYDLEGVRFITGVQFDFTDSAIPRLASGGCVLVVKNKAAFEKRYGPGLPIAGEYSGRFDNAGEHIVAVGAQNEIILEFTYGTTPPWPAEADGLGYSLEVINFQAGMNAAANWRLSGAVGGSPGRFNFKPIVLESVTFQGTQFAFWFTGAASAGYTVYERDSLALGAWQVLLKGNPIASNGPVEIRIDNSGSSPTRFFRVSIP